MTVLRVENLRLANYTINIEFINKEAVAFWSYDKKLLLDFLILSPESITITTHAFTTTTIYMIIRSISRRGCILIFGKNTFRH